MKFCEKYFYVELNNLARVVSNYDFGDFRIKLMAPKKILVMKFHF